jgi:hypothetical protein
MAENFVSTNFVPTATGVPSWVPLSVREITSALPVGDKAIARRLLIDPRMKSVWRGTQIFYF